MFRLTLFDLEYETSVSISEFEMMIVINDSFDFIPDRYTIKFTEHKWKLGLLKNSETLIFIWILLFSISIIEI